MTAERPEPIEEYAIGTDKVLTIPPSFDEEMVVPVRVVEGGRAREIRRHRLFNVPLNIGVGANTEGEITQVVGPNENRSRMRIYNTHATDSVRLLDDGGQASFTGFILAAGKDVDIFTEGAVYAVVPAAGVNVVVLSVVDEFVITEA